MKFTEWMRIKEEMGGMTQAGQSVLGAIGKIQGGKDTNISKFVKDIVSDKTGNPKNMANKGAKVAALLRSNAAKAADSGDYTGAFKNATDAAKMSQIASSIK